MSTAATQVLLAETWSEDVDPTDWWMSEKLDGVRAYWNGSNFYSRQGNLFHVPDFFKAKLPKVPLDGEIWCGRGLFQKCISIVKKQGNKVVSDDYKFLTYLIFDAPSHGGKYEDRVKWLQANIPQNDDQCYAAVVGIKKCTGLADLKQCLADVNKVGGEGIMLRKPGSRYENKRSSTLLKVKTFYDEEALVVGHKPGKGNFTGMLGALECKLPNGKRFDVGSGFNMDQRRKPPTIGSVITFKFQELSNNGIPRFPTFLRIRSDLTWKDVLEAAKTKQPVSLKKKVVPSTKLSKQHSILFSVIPSRDENTGKKVITTDDVDDNASEGETFVSPSKSTINKTSRNSTSKNTRQSSIRSTKSVQSAQSRSRKPGKKQSDDLEELTDATLPSTTDNLLVKDKNKGRRFDDVDDDQEEESKVSKRVTKRKRNLEEEKPAIKSERKRIRKS